MNKYFKERSLYTFTAIVLGITLLLNLNDIAVKISGEFRLYPYLITMGIANIFACIGFFKKDVQFLAYSSIAWIVSIAFNPAAIILIIPVLLLNITGRNKVLNKIELNKNDNQKEQND